MNTTRDDPGSIVKGNVFPLVTSQIKKLASLPAISQLWAPKPLLSSCSRRIERVSPLVICSCRDALKDIINSCGITHNAFARGYSVYLCEADDLASGASSQSIKLIHAALRYLEHCAFRWYLSIH